MTIDKNNEGAWRICENINVNKVFFFLHHSTLKQKYIIFTQKKKQ